MRALLGRLFGGRIDPAAVAPGPVTALPFGLAEFGRRLSVRVFYSPHPAHLSDLALVHRAMLACAVRREGPGGRPEPPWEAAYHRFAPLCVRLPARLAGPAPVWA